MKTLAVLVGLVSLVFRARSPRLMLRDVLDYRLDRAAMHDATTDQKIAVVRARYAARRTEK